MLPIEPAALLRQAAAVISTVWPTTTTTFHCQGFAFRARFEYPACVVAVYERNTGKLVAQSIAGLPWKLAQE